MISKPILDRLQAAACFAVLCVILVAGLSPFNPRPRNKITWLANSGGLHFDRQAVALSSREFAPPDSGAPASCSIEIWGHADEVFGTGTLLGFYSADRPASFLIRQFRKNLVFQRTLRSSLGEREESHMAVEAFRADQPFVATLTANAQARTVYVDGLRLEQSARLAPFCADLSGWLVIGTSPVADSGWRGTLRGLGIFRRELSEAEVLEDVRSWRETGRPSNAAKEDLRALYLFDERTGDRIHDATGHAPDLVIPDHYLVPFKPFLEAPWKEFEPTLGFLSDIFINVAGFVPFGFVFCSYFTTVRRLDRALAVTILLGFLVSLTIETLQAFLPTRESGMTDLITNTTGTAIGTILFRWRPVQSLYSHLGITA